MQMTKAMSVPNQKARQVMDFQSGVGRSWLLRVKVVQNTIDKRTYAALVRYRSLAQGKLL
jgi:hypothetical protein